MKLVIDQKLGRQQLTEKEVLYRVTLINDDEEVYRNTSVRLKNIKGINFQTKEREFMEDFLHRQVEERLRDLPLLLTHDLKVPPILQFNLDPGQSRTVDVIQSNREIGMFVIWHALRMYWRDPNEISKIIEEPEPAPYIPAHDYVLTIEATAQEEKHSIEQQFNIGLDSRGVLTFNPKVKQ
jgi:hypothetical protein